MDTASATVALLYGLLIAGVQSASFGFTNNCTKPVWVGTLSGAGTPPLAQTGFQLDVGASTSLSAPPAWSGRFWGRTGCAADLATGQFTCATGDCASGKVVCEGAGAVPPATLVEITLGTDGRLDFYDVSLVDGYNLPVAVTPVDGTGDCRTASCPRDVNAACPPELRVVGPDGGVAACKSACLAFRRPEFCCTGAFGDPTACKPTTYSQIFKSNCPSAYSYAFDDQTSIFTCGGATYHITFCP